MRWITGLERLCVCHPLGAAVWIASLRALLWAAYLGYVVSHTPELAAASIRVFLVVGLVDATTISILVWTLLRGTGRGSASSRFDGLPSGRADPKEAAERGG